MLRKEGAVLGLVVHACNQSHSGKLRQEHPKSGLTGQQISKDNARLGILSQNLNV